MAHVDWRTAYDKQMDLWSWWQTPAGYRVAEGYMNAIIERGAGTTTQIERLVEGQQEVMFRADPVVIDDDMMTLIEAAARLPAGAAARRGPAHADRLRVAAAAVQDSRRPREVADHPRCRVGAGGLPARIGPSPEKGLMMAYYSWVGDAAEDDLGDDLYMFRDAMGSDLSLVHWEPWLFGESYNAASNTPGSPGVTLRFIQTMWRLMQQTIATHGRERPDRAARRRAEKRGMADKVVTVIRLRRPKKPVADDHEPKAVEWSHRWITRGHWRNQWFPSLGEAADATAHRSIWISQYVKGPEDKPLIASKLRAFEWTR